MQTPSIGWNATDQIGSVVAHIIPSGEKLRMQRLHLSAGKLTLELVSLQAVGACPVCGQQSKRVHSTYTRTLHDLPWGALPLCLSVHVHRFFCSNPVCIRTIFTERLPELVEPSARRTNHLRDILLTIGWALGGRAGVRHVAAIHLSPICTSTLLAMLRRQGVPPTPTPRVLGVDDWSFRAHEAGTILVDLERHQPVDLLLGSSEEVFARWLVDHPGVDVISRDRGASYLKGATTGAPHATQILDRWHLIKNLGEVLQKALARYLDVLRQAGQETTNHWQDLPLTPERLAHLTTGQRKPRRRKAPTLSPHRVWQRTIYQHVHELAAQGLSHHEIASRLQIHRQTVRKYLRLPSFVDRRHSPTPSLAEPYRAYLQQRWAEGEVQIKTLWQEIQQQGFAGSYSCVWKFLRTWPFPQGMVSQASWQGVPVSTRLPPLTRTPRQARWLLLRDPACLNKADAAYRQALFRLSPAIESFSTLGRALLRMLERGEAEALDDWLVQAKMCASEEMCRFALDLEGEYAALRGAITQPWSTGPVEGQITRLKLFKRQMYGHAKIDLLRLRMLHRDTP